MFNAGAGYISLRSSLSAWMENLNKGLDLWGQPRSLSFPIKVAGSGISAADIAMFAAIFEILPKRERFENYLILAKQLRPLLQKMDGFLDNERFESKTRKG